MPTPPAHPDELARRGLANSESHDAIRRAIKEVFKGTTDEQAQQALEAALRSNSTRNIQREPITPEPK